MATNAAWDAVFLPAAAIMASCSPTDSGGKGGGPLGPALMVGACVHPQDRGVCFQSLAVALFGRRDREGLGVRAGAAGLGLGAGQRGGRRLEPWATQVIKVS